MLTKTTIFAEYPHYLFTGLSMDYWIVAAFRSPLMKALDRSVETLGLWIVTSLVTFIKLANQSSIKLCPIVHLVALWTLIYFVGRSYLSIASGVVQWHHLIKKKKIELHTNSIKTFSLIFSCAEYHSLKSPHKNLMSSSLFFWLNSWPYLRFFSLKLL